MDGMVKGRARDERDGGGGDLRECTERMMFEDMGDIDDHVCKRSFVQVF